MTIIPKISICLLYQYVSSYLGYCLFQRLFQWMSLMTRVINVQSSMIPRVLTIELIIPSYFPSVHPSLLIHTLVRWLQIYFSACLYVYSHIYLQIMDHSVHLYSLYRLESSVFKIICAEISFNPPKSFGVAGVSVLAVRMLMSLGWGMPNIENGIKMPQSTMPVLDYCTPEFILLFTILELFWSTAILL